VSGVVVLRRAVHDRRRWLIGWSLGIVGLVVSTTAFWPSFSDKADEMNDIIDKMPDSVKSLVGMGGGIDPFSPVGYLSSQVFALMLPLLLLIGGIGLAASIAGDEEHGLLETGFALPMPRRRLLLERWFSVMTLSGALCVVTFIAVAVVARAVDLRVGVGAMWWASVSAALLAWSFAAVALAAGAITGRRSIAIAVASVLAVASYLVTSLADAGIGAFRSVRSLSLFTHYAVLHSLQRGTPPWSLLVLVAVVAVGVGFALWAIDRRDLRAG
jgi:ABC-2 type transport system permease protein